MPTDPIYFPALDNGMLAHLPIRLGIEKLYRFTQFPDGSTVVASSESKTRYTWNLQYENLNTSEWQKLNSFIQSSHRGSQSFAFYDPLGNLLAKSTDLQDAVWIASPGLVVDTIADSEQSNAFILTNPTSQPLSITQSVGIAGPFTCCFSLMTKWAGGAAFSLSLSDAVNVSSQSLQALGWRRQFIVGLASPTAQVRIAGLVVPPTTQVIVAAPQLEIASAPGAYLETETQSGVFPVSWLSNKSFDSQSNAPGAHSINLRIESLINS